MHAHTSKLIAHVTQNNNSMQDRENDEGAGEVTSSRPRVVVSEHSAAIGPFRSQDIQVQWLQEELWEAVFAPVTASGAAARVFVRLPPNVALRNEISKFCANHEGDISDYPEIVKLRDVVHSAIILAGGGPQYGQESWDGVVTVNQRRTHRNGANTPRYMRIEFKCIKCRKPMLRGDFDNAEEEGFVMFEECKANRQVEACIARECLVQVPLTTTLALQPGATMATTSVVVPSTPTPSVVPSTPTRSASEPVAGGPSSSSTVSSASSSTTTSRASSPTATRNGLSSNVSTSSSNTTSTASVATPATPTTQAVPWGFLSSGTSARTPNSFVKRSSSAASNPEPLKSPRMESNTHDCVLGFAAVAVDDTQAPPALESSHQTSHLNTNKNWRNTFHDDDDLSDIFAYFEACSVEETTILHPLAAVGGGGGTSFSLASAGAPSAVASSSHPSEGANLTSATQSMKPPSLAERLSRER